MRGGHIFIFLLLSIGFLVFFSSPALAWYYGYSYEKTVMIGSSPDGLSNYQITLNVYSGNGTDSVNTMFLDNHAMNFPNDIRFTSGTDAIYHYALAYSNATYAQFVIKVTSISTTDNQQMRVYYGKAGDSSNSDPADTYDYTQGGTYYLNIGGTSTHTLSTMSRACWYTVPFSYTLDFGNYGPGYEMHVGTSSGSFSFGNMGQTPGISAPLTAQYTVVYNDGSTTNNVQVYSNTGALVGTYSANFGSDHSIVASANMYSPVVAQAVYGPVTAVAYAAHPPGMGLWSDETTQSNPIVSFTQNVTSGVAPFAVQFNDTSTSGVSSWLWNFGDGWTSTAQNPVHVYTTGGNYTVSFTATNAYASNTTYGMITSNSAPIANIQYIEGSQIGSSVTVYFYDASTGGAPTSWQWNFGDNSTNSSQQNPSHPFTSTGGYKITLTASNTYGSNSTSVSLNVSIVSATSKTLVITNNGVSVGSGVSVKLTDAGGNTVFSTPTDSTGTVVPTGISSGTLYTVKVSGSGIPSYTGSLTMSDSEYKYWIDVGTQTVTSDSQHQATELANHLCTIKVIDWWDALKTATITVTGNGGSQTGTTDDQGQAGFNVNGVTSYTVHIVQPSAGVDYTGNYTMSGTTLTITVNPINANTIWNALGIHSNYSTVNNPTGYDPSGVGSHIAAGTLNGQTVIYAMTKDTSGNTITTAYTLYEWHTGLNDTTIIGTQESSGNNNTVTFNVDNPYSANFEVEVVDHQGGGDVKRYFDYTWPGPAWRLPGVPIDLYQWIVMIILGIVLLGTANERNVAYCGLMTSIAGWILWGSGWMYQWSPQTPAILMFITVMSGVQYMNNKNRGLP